jgi:hypothetical protein
VVEAAAAPPSLEGTGVVMLDAGGRGAGVPRTRVVEVVLEVAGREGLQGRRDCGRREMGLGLDAALYTQETR